MRIEIDARGPRFSATLTAIVLAIALITHNVWVLAFQGLVFAIGALRGPQAAPYAFIFKKFVKPRLSGPAILEDIRPPQFAQRVGLAFAVVGLIGGFTDIPLLFQIATSFAFAAAFLNSAFNFCLGCFIYLRLRRLTKLSKVA